MKKSVSIIGGPAALILAALLNGDKFDVTIYRRNKSLGRKFLVAGKGGFNLTHSDPLLN
jgi:predicted flavoprotein YhiN